MIGAGLIRNIGAAITAVYNALAASGGAALVGFIQTGAGAVKRTLQDVLGESVSVKDYGAVMDGVANDAAALQAAIDALPASGGTVRIPLGVLLLSAAVSTPKPVRLVGAGRMTFNEATPYRGSTILIGAGGSLAFDGGAAIVHSGPELRNLNFVEVGEAKTKTAVLIRLQNRWTVQECSFRGFDKAIVADAAQAAVAGGDASWGKVDQCVFRSCAYGVVSPDQAAANQSGASLLVTAGDFECSTAGVYLGIHTPQTRVIGAKMDCVGGVGVWIKGYANIVMGSTFEGCATAVLVQRDTAGTSHANSGTGNLVIGNNMTGRLGTETGVTFDANATGNQAMGNRFSNLATQYTDTAGANLRFDALEIRWNTANGVITMPNSASFLNQIIAKGTATVFAELNSTGAGGKQWRIRSLTNGKLNFQDVTDGVAAVSLTSGGGIELAELAADHAASTVNAGVIFARDNGAGKSQICVRFASGAVQVLATEP